MLLNFRSRRTTWVTAAIADSISSGVLNLPNPNRRLLRVASSLRPKARNTWLGSGLADVQALPELTATRPMFISSASPST